MLSPRTTNHIWMVIALILGLGLTAFAQQDYAKLEGQVHDKTGAVIPNATVKIQSPALGVERSVTANAEGVYVAPQLRPGAYKLTIEAAGFKSSSVTDLVLGVGQSRHLDIQLEAGQLSETVNIVASDEPATVDTSSARLGANVTAREVAELPVNGRNVSQLYILSPGATNVGSGNFNEIRFNGRSNQQNQVKLDGIESTAIWDASPGYLTVQGSQFRLQTSLENIQEFRVDSSNYPAEYGTGTGGQITVIGKRGENQFHGSVFEYARNDKFDAPNFFDAAGEKSKLRLNQFGGSLGGRIIRDRLWFFGSYEGLRQRAGFNIIESTPSDYVRDFINYFGTTDTRGEAARAALNISTANATAALPRIQNLRALGVINAFPIGDGARSNVGGLNNSAQLVQGNRVAALNENAFSVRMDAALSQNINGYVRYQRTTGELNSPDGLTGRVLVADQQPDNFVAALTQTYASKFINETKFGINRAASQLRTSFPAVAGSTLDFSKSAFILTGGIVQTGVNGGAAAGFSSPGGLTRQSSAGNGRAQPIRPATYNIIDTLSWLQGNHQIKIGGEYRRIIVDFDQLGGFQYSYGSLSDFALNQNLTAAFIGDMSAAGSFRVATNPITTVTRDKEGFHRSRQNYLIGFAQDEWKIRPNFTMNYGVRFEYYSPVTEQDGRAVVVDAATGQFRPGNEAYFQVSKNWGPRLAFTWAPEFLKGKTVIRVGGGLFYGPGQYEDLIQPIESDVLRSTTAIAGGLDSTVPGRVSTVTAPVTNFAPRVYDFNGYRLPERVGQYGLSIQQQLPGNTVLTVAYVGSQGRNLFQRNITNVILPGNATVASGAALPANVGIVNVTDATGRVIAVRQVRQFSLINKALDASGNVIDSTGAVLAPFGEMDYKTSGGRDSYNAMQVTVNRRFTAGLTLGGQYQWAHSIGTTQGSNEAQTAQDPFNFNGERGNNTFDIRHTVNINALYELPFGKGRKWGLDGVANLIAGGWQLGGILNARTGTPLNILITRPDVVIQCTNAAAGCTAGEVRALPGTINATTPLPAGFTAVINTPGGNNTRNTRRPDRVAGVDPYISVGGQRFLNPAAFTIPKPGTYGNLSRGALYGPGFGQFDLTLQKRFSLTEKVRFEFRTEIYNLFNRNNFANPPVTLPNNLPTQQPGTPYTFTSETSNNVGNFGLINGTVSRTVGLGTNRQVQFSGRITF